MRMIKALICGACGKMGGTVCGILHSGGKIKAVCGVDYKRGENFPFPVYDDFSSVAENIDIIIDFSAPAVLKGELEWAIKNNVPVVLAPTGYTQEDLNLIKKSAEKIAIFKSANFSVGINLLAKLVRKAAETLGSDFDIEIVEKHHSLKTDAPSGTALMLAESANRAFSGEKRYVCGRQGITGPRKDEIGIHSVRGGTIVGEHEVIFAGDGEIITFSHSAQSKKIFAAGAVKAAEWLIGKPAGLYDMDDLTESF